MAVDASDPAAIEDVAIGAYLRGDDGGSADAWERAHTRFAAEGRTADSARCAFWAGFAHMLRGEHGPASGWLARARRCAEDAGSDCPTWGLLLVPDFLQALGSGAATDAGAIADRILEAGRRTGDPDVLGFGLLCSGEARVALGHLDEGMQLLDEAMVGVTSGELSPIASGIVYCAVIETCVDTFDLRRASEWTDALDRWCDAQPVGLPFRGQCMVHRAQVLGARGAWADAVAEASRAYERLAAAAHPAAGTALYQLGELHRVRGDLREADDAYRRAHQHGCDPEPGLALLRLAAGDIAGAVSAIQRALSEASGRRGHVALLPAAAEIFLAAGQVEQAQRAVVALLELTASGAPLPLSAMAHYADAALALAAGEPQRAGEGFRSAREIWLAVGVPYEAARCREQLGMARRRLDDADGAGIELAAALADFEALGATLDVARIGAAITPAPAPPGGLSRREVQVLRVVATGATNREIAAALSISEHTVARHLQNIYAKLGLSSRAAATAYAHANGLV
jgi:DNA-binding CsgD family transcriptional regulator